MAWKQWTGFIRFKGQPGPPAEYQWTFSGPASVNEGEAIDWVLSFDINGATIGVGEVINISFRGQTTPLPGAFSGSIGDALTAAERAGVVNGGNLNLLIDMNAWDQQPITISRGTVFISEAQGNKTCSLEAYNITKGEIVGSGVVEVDILDLPPPAPEGTELADFTISGAVTKGGLPWVYVAVDAPIGTVVGTVTAVTGDLTSVEFVTPSSKFALDGVTLEAAVLLDFEVSQPPGSGALSPFFTIALRGHGPNASVVEKSFRIGGIMPEIAPTGGGAATPNVVSDVSSLRAAIQSVSNPTDPRVTMIDPSMPTIYEVNGNNKTSLKRSNYTLRGHYRSVAIKDRCIDVEGGDNILIEDIVSKAGSDVGGALLGNRDSIVVSHAALDISNLMFRHDEFSLSVDELGSVISGAGPFTRRVIWDRCAFYEPYENAGHPEGFHAFALLIYNHQGFQVVRRCFFSSSAMRHPNVAKSRFVQVENNIICYRAKSGGHAGTKFYSTNSTVENNMQATGIVRGNLYWPHPGYNRDRALSLDRVGPGSYVHFAEAGDIDSAAYPNHFFNPVTLSFADDPVTRAAHLKLLNGASALSAIDYDPFQPYAFTGAHETDSAIKREAMFWDVFLGAGACERDVNDDPIFGKHNKQLYDCKSRLLLNGGFRNISPASIDEDWYGVGGNWNLGGSLGKINDEAPLLEEV